MSRRSKPARLASEPERFLLRDPKYERNLERALLSSLRRIDSPSSSPQAAAAAPAVVVLKEEEEEDKRKKAKRKTSRAKTKAKPPKFLESRHWEKTKYLGVQQHKGTGEYRTVVRGKTFGCYATCTEAATQYDEIALRLDADAPTNFPARGLPLYAAPLPPSWLGDDAKSSEDLKAPKNKKRRHHPPRATGAPKTTDDEPPSSSDARQDDDDGEEDDEAILVHSDDEAYRP